MDLSALQTSGLANHIFHNDIMNLTEGSAVLQHLPWLVGVVMNFDQILITDGDQAVAFEVFNKIILNSIFVKAFAFDQQLGIVTEFDHADSLLLTL